jgi:hypothetical protein
LNGFSSSRRDFLKTLGATSAWAGLGHFPTAASIPKGEPGRKKIALLATEVRKHSHGQHFIDRFLEGYGWEGRHYHPAVDLVSLYIDQFPKNDLSRDRARRHRVKIYPSIREALTLGGKELAVDGVVIIAEHGKYARTLRGQTLYPRYQFFKEIVRVFEQSGRAVPVFNDKHLSTDWDECVEMIEDSRRLGFAFLAGSSLPVTWRIPSVDVPFNAPLKESVCVCYGGADSYDIHGLETAQCMSERREGGERGVRSIHAVRGEKVWRMLAAREATQALFLAALSQSHTVRGPAGYGFAWPNFTWFSRACPDPIAYFIEHRDGFRTSMFLLNGLVSDFTYAGRIEGEGILACQMHLPMPTRISTTADFFNPLVYHIEQTILTGQASYPAERTLLTSGMTLFAVASLHRGQVALETPELEVAYRATEHSTYWRA